jgi:hypothetical protein
MVIFERATIAPDNAIISPASQRAVNMAVANGKEKNLD